MLLQLPPRAEAVLACNYEPRVVNGWVGQVSEGLNGVASSKCLRVVLIDMKTGSFDS